MNKYLGIFFKYKINQLHFLKFQVSVKCRLYITSEIKKFGYGMSMQKKKVGMKSIQENKRIQRQYIKVHAQ